MAYVLTVLNCLFSILYSYFPPRENKQAQSDDSFKAGNRQLPEGAAFLAKCETDLKKHQQTCFVTSRVPPKGDHSGNASTFWFREVSTNISELGRPFKKTPFTRLALFIGCRWVY
jgi:hypothetical protein